MKRPITSSGFTIIEIMIVLVLAAVILLIVFLSVPAMQRNARNTKRDHDAAVILQAISECMANNNLDRTKCDAIGDIAPYMGPLSIFTGYHYGSHNPPTDTISYGPTTDEPNWLFNIKCNDQRDNVIITYIPTQYVVGYAREVAGGSYEPRCIDG